MFDEEGNGDVKTQELERLMSLMGINPTKRELSQMAKDVDKSGEYKATDSPRLRKYRLSRVLHTPVKYHLNANFLYVNKIQCNLAKIFLKHTILVPL